MLNESSGIFYFIRVVSTKPIVMKYHLLPFSIVAAISLAIISCEKKEDKEILVVTYSTEVPVVVSQHEALAIRLMDKSQEVFDIVLQVEDLQSANQASSQIIQVAGEIDAIYKELDALGPAPDDVKPIIQEKLKERDKLMLAKRIEVNQLLKSLPEDATQVIVNAMTECSKVMESNLSVFKRCFGIS